MTAYEKYEKLRDQANETSYAVSKSTGISQTTLSEWKSGKYTPKIDKFVKLAKHFGVPLEELVGD